MTCNSTHRVPHASQHTETTSLIPYTTNSSRSTQVGDALIEDLLAASVGLGAGERLETPDDTKHRSRRRRGLTRRVERARAGTTGQAALSRTPLAAVAWYLVTPIEFRRPTSRSSADMTRDYLLALLARLIFGNELVRRILTEVALRTKSMIRPDKRKVGEIRLTSSTSGCRRVLRPRRVDGNDGDCDGKTNRPAWLPTIEVIRLSQGYGHGPTHETAS